MSAKNTAARPDSDDGVFQEGRVIVLGQPPAAGGKQVTAEPPKEKRGLFSSRPKKSHQELVVPRASDYGVVMMPALKNFDRLIFTMRGPHGPHLRIEPEVFDFFLADRITSGPSPETLPPLDLRVISWDVPMTTKDVVHDFTEDGNEETILTPFPHIWQCLMSAAQKGQSQKSAIIAANAPHVFFSKDIFEKTRAVVLTEFENICFSISAFSANRSHPWPIGTRFVLPHVEEE